MKDVIIATDFFPKIGGAHYWLYQVYRYWPENVMAFVQDYSNDPTLSLLQKKFDESNLGSLVLKRYDLSLDPPTLFSIKNIKKIFDFYKLLKRNSSLIQLHILRVIPDGYFAILPKLIRPTKYKLFVYAHGEEFLIAKTSREFNLIAKLILKTSDLVIANSFFTKNKVEGFVPTAKVGVFHLGVNYSDYQGADDEILSYREKLGISQESLVLLTVARMEPRKNHKRVLEVLRNLISEGHLVDYIIIGSGEQERCLRELVSKLEIQDRVHFLGTVSEKEKVLAFNTADIFIMPSVQHGSLIEGFGIVFLEAAAAGIPCIAGKVGGQPEAVLDGKTGIVVNGEDRKEIYNAVRYLIMNPQVRRKMGEEARKWARQNDWQLISRKIYDAVLEV